MRMSTAERDVTYAHWTLMRFGKAGCRSTGGPRRRTRLSSSASVEITQWGFPTDTAVTDSAAPSTSLVALDFRATALRVDGEGRSPCVAVLPEILGEDAEPVSRFLGLAPVG